MINTIVQLNDIKFDFIEPGNLLESIKKRGIAIPVQVNKKDEGYVCLDGNKRLSACFILSKIDPKFLRIPVVLMNDYSKAGSSYWGNTQNKH